MGETGRLISRHARYILSYSVCYPLQFCVEEWIKILRYLLHEHEKVDFSYCNLFRYLY